MPENEEKREAEARGKEISAGIKAGIGAAVKGLTTAGKAGYGAGKQVIRTLSGFNFLILAVLIFLFHWFIDVQSNFFIIWRLLFYGAIILPWGAMYVGWRRSAEVSLFTLLLPILALSNTFGIPALVKYIGFLSPVQTTLEFAVVFIPVWFVYLLFIASPQLKIARFFFVAYVIITIALIILSGQLTPILQSLGVSAEDLTPPPGLVKKFSLFMSQVLKNAKEVPQAVSRMWQQQIAVATGDYYLGQVEENKAEPLGVTLENVQSANPFFYEGELVTVWATVKARSIDDEVTITPACSADEKIPGEIPLGGGRKNFTIVSLEEQDIECRIPTLTKGTYTIDFDAVFDFKTMSYMKSYFMDRNRLRSMLSEGIDPLTEYKITDRTPITTFTNGPVMIGMDLPTPPIGIDPNAIPPTFGITVSNRWQGKLLRIKKLVIYIPEGFSIKTGTPGSVQQRGDCSHKFDPYTPTEEEHQEGYVAYALNERDPVMVHLAELQEIRAFQTFRCRLSIDNPDKILGDTPITTRYFKATVEYDYVTSKSTSVQVKEGLYSSVKPPEEVKPMGNPPAILVEMEEKGYKEMVEKQAGDANHHEFVAAIMAAENPDLNPAAVSPTGCKGLMQFCAATAYDYGLCGDDRCRTNDRRAEATPSIEKGSIYLRDIKNRFGKYGNDEMVEYYTTSAYNGGPELIERAIAMAGEFNPSWEKVYAQITPELMKSIPDYTRCWGPTIDQCWNDENRAKKKLQINQFTNNVMQYRRAFDGHFK